ncbi:hypothetical protein BA190_10015 [Labrys sp. WJW]|uniref:tellurite resistance TerB family protein n=1 Tax=Labrys sp. WJW TaxID=1737983 RepID=UPI000830F697|nr:TerB family tellurite resistance protein [Labrys sp. WJW]OCC05229.1 hypothetical protein BA190_10015 [Labrys sp. WJW]
MFASLKRAFKGATREVAAEYGQNKDFLEAVCAAAALVAAADGDIEDSERRKLVSLVQNHSTLSKLYQSNVIEQTAETMFKRAKEASGRQQLARELDDIKSLPNGAQMAEDVYLLAQDIANADGEVEPEEDVVLKKIASRLGVDTSKFDF